MNGRLPGPSVGNWSSDEESKGNRKLFTAKKAAARRKTKETSKRKAGKPARKESRDETS